MNATRQIICFSAIVVLQAGCATQAPKPPEITPQQLANVGVANVQFLPTLSLDEAKGIETGMALQRCSGIGVPAIVTLACIPFAAQSAAEALRAGTSTLTPAQAEAHFRERLSTLRPQSALREYLTGYAKEQGMAGVRAIEEGPAAREEQHKYRAAPDGPSTVIEVAIVQVAAHTTGVGNIPYFFTVTANGRLVRTSDNAVLDTFANTQATRALSADAWVADDGKVLAHELDRAYRRLAEAFVDEWFLIYRVPAESAAPAAAPQASSSGGVQAGTASSAVPAGYSGGMRWGEAVSSSVPTGASDGARPEAASSASVPSGYSGGMRWGEAASSAVPSGYSGGMQSGTASGAAQQDDTSIVPPYALRPLSPAVRRGLRGPTSASIMGNLIADRVDSLQPTFRWEALPRPALSAPDAAAAKPVYEVRIFRALPRPYLGMRWLVPHSEPEIEVGGLTVAEFRPTEPLVPCAFYFWTVRARFESAGSRKVTEWSGAYHAGIAPFEPWWERRSYRPPMAGGPMTPEWLYFPFQTPDTSGKSC